MFQHSCARQKELVQISRPALSNLTHLVTETDAVSETSCLKKKTIKMMEIVE
jgi:hypothetical protein